MGVVEVQRADPNPPISPATRSAYISRDAGAAGTCSGSWRALAPCPWSGRTSHEMGGDGSAEDFSWQLPVKSSGRFAGQSSIFSGGSSGQRAVECGPGPTSYRAWRFRRLLVQPRAIPLSAQRSPTMRTITLMLGLAAVSLGQQIVTCATDTVSYSSFTATGSQEITILTGVSGNVRYNQITLSETTKFNNIMGLTVSMGRPGVTNNMEMTGDRFALGVSSGDSNFWNTRPGQPRLTSNYSVVLNFAVPSGTLNVADAGVLTWEVCGYTAPTVGQNTYLVGDVAPFTSDTAPNFGDGKIDVLDLTQVLFAVNNVPGSRPAACSDRFDAMDLYPVDTVSSRGGDGVLDILDLIRELLRVNNLDLDRPVRVTQGGTCSSITGAAATRRNAEFALGAQADAHGRLVLGTPECTTGIEQRVPVYVEAGYDLKRVAVTFALGDQRSQLRFVPSPHTLPSLAQDSRLGVVALAWLEGLSVRAGERLLLGDIVGPTGTWPSLQVYGLSALELDDNREVLMNASTVAETEPEPVISHRDPDGQSSVTGKKSKGGSQEHLGSCPKSVISVRRAGAGERSSDIWPQ
jgi:hypothetical protein